MFTSELFMIEKLKGSSPNAINIKDNLPGSVLDNEIQFRKGK